MLNNVCLFSFVSEAMFGTSRRFPPEKRKFYTNLTTELAYFLRAWVKAKSIFFFKLLKIWESVGDMVLKHALKYFDRTTN